MEDFFNMEGPEQVDLKRKTIDVKLIIGILLILISIFLSVISNVISLGGLYSLKYDAAYSVAFLLAPVAIMAILSAVILLTGKDKRGRNFLVFSIIALLLTLSNLSLSVGEAVAESQKEDVAINKIVSLIKDLMSEKEIIEEDISEGKYGKSAPIVEILQDIYLEFQDIKKDNKSIVAIMNDTSTFSSETLTDLNRIKEKIAVLEQTSKDIEALGNNINNLMDEFKTDVGNANIGKAIKAGVMSGLEDSFYNSTDTSANNLKYMDNVIKSMKNMLVFLEENYGAYILEGEQLLFYKDEDVEAYNKLFEEYNKAIDENNRNYEDVLKNVNEKIKEIDKYSK